MEYNEFIIRPAEEEKLLKHILRTFNTLPFCRRWLDREDGGSFKINQNHGRQAKCIQTLNQLVRNGIVEVQHIYIHSI